MLRLLARGTSAAFALISLLACTPAPDPVEPKPTPVDATCRGYCGNARLLNCEAAQPTPGGASCEAVCENATQAGVRWNLGCRSIALSCEAIDACER